MDIQNQTILITGGTSGIGKALALSLKEKNTVIVTGRSEARLEEARKNGLITIQADLTKREDLDQLVMTIEQQYPQLNVLINNAGIQYNYHMLRESDTFQRIQQEIQVNLTGTIQLTQLLLPVLCSKPSQILNVSSALGVVPKSDGIVYSASKAGLRNFTRGLRKILKEQPVQVIEVIPPVTDTRMTAGRDEEKMPVEELVLLILKQWSKGKTLIAPGKIKLLMTINRWWPSLADSFIK
jgi:uncharacterized oxidoreductase